MNRAKLLNDRLAWFEIFKFDTTFKTELIRKINAQLQDGKNSEGEIVGYYSPVTEIITRGRKKAYDPYNFYDTGKFRKSLFIRYNLDSIKFDGDGQKQDENIILKYSRDGDLLGISPQNMDWFISQMREKYISYARKVLFGSR